MATKNTNAPIVNDTLIDWVIKEEGFLDKPTNIGDGKITLGSGLTAQKWRDKYRKNGNKWTKQDNRAAVREELESRKRWAEDTIPNWENLPDDTKRAMLSYKYNYDFDAKNSPKLFSAMKSGDYIEAVRQMDATSKDPKFKKGLQERRNREQAWGLGALIGSNAPIYQEALPIVEYPDNTRVFNPYTPLFEDALARPALVPANPTTNYVEARQAEPEEWQQDDALAAFRMLERAKNYRDSMLWENQPELPQRDYNPTEAPYLVTRYDKGGNLEKKKTWDELSVKEKADMMRVAVENGITSLSEIKDRYNEFAENADIEETVENVNKSKADFVNRLKDVDRQYIKDWEHPGYIATHKPSVGTDSKGNNYIYPEVQNIDGELVDFTRPPYLPYAGIISAEERGDTVRVPSIEQGVRFTENYKKYYPKGKTFAEGGHIYDGTTEDNQQMDTSQSLKDMLKRFEDAQQGEPINGGTLKEIIVRRSEDPVWILGQKNPAIQKALWEAYASENENDLEDGFPYSLDKPSATRLLEVYREAGDPSIKALPVGRHRSVYSPITNTAKVDTSVPYYRILDKVVNELSHPLQSKYGNNIPWVEHLNVFYDRDNYRGKTRYDYPNKYESETHSDFEPLLKDYIRDNILHGQGKMTVKKDGSYLGDWNEVDKPTLEQVLDSARVYNKRKQEFNWQPDKYSASSKRNKITQFFGDLF